MNILEATIPRLREDTSLVALLQVMTDVYETSSFEGGSKLSRPGVTGNKTREPVTGDAHTRNHLALAHVL